MLMNASEALKQATTVDKEHRVVRETLFAKYMENLRDQNDNTISEAIRNGEFHTALRIGEDDIGKRAIILERERLEGLGYRTATTSSVFGPMGETVWYLNVFWGPKK